MRRTLLHTVILALLSTTIGIAQVVHVKSPNSKIDMALENGAKIDGKVDRYQFPMIL